MVIWRVIWFGWWFNWMVIPLFWPLFFTFGGVGGKKSFTLALFLESSRLYVGSFNDGLTQVANILVVKCTKKSMDLYLGSHPPVILNLVMAYFLKFYSKMYFLVEKEDLGYVCSRVTRAGLKTANAVPLIAGVHWMDNIQKMIPLV